VSLPLPLSSILFLLPPLLPPSFVSHLVLILSISPLSLCICITSRSHSLYLSAPLLFPLFPYVRVNWLPAVDWIVRLLNAAPEMDNAGKPKKSSMRLMVTSSPETAPCAMPTAVTRSYGRLGVPSPLADPRGDAYKTTWAASAQELFD